jgi:hypothetical protein
VVLLTFTKSNDTRAGVGLRAGGLLRAFAGSLVMGVATSRAASASRVRIGIEIGASLLRSPPPEGADFKRSASRSLGSNGSWPEIRNGARSPQARIIHERLRPSRGSFSAMLRQASSAMHPGIAVVGLPCLTEKSLAGTRCA